MAESLATREIAALEARLRVALACELDRRLDLLERYVDDELAAITRRIDHVHTQALRALSARVNATSIGGSRR